jgi:hypothetical protein
MMPELERRLLEKWSEFALPGERPRRVEFLAACPPGEGRSHVLFLAFRPGAGAPVAIAKVRRSPCEGDKLWEEAAVLQDLRERLPATLRDTLPRVLEVRDFQGQRALVLEGPKGTFLAGQAAWRWPARRSTRLREVLRIGLGWLCAFQQATRGEPLMLEGEQLERRALALIGACRGWLGAAPTATLREAVAEALAGAPLFLCGRHGALRPEHLVRYGTRLTVVSWEQAERSALPLFDPLQVVTSASAECARHRAGAAPEVAAFRETWLEATPVRGVAATALAGYATAMGISARAVAWALPVFAADQALRAGSRPSAKHHWHDCLRLLAEDPGALAGLAEALRSQG